VSDSTGGWRKEKREGLKREGDVKTGLTRKLMK
jgi:hypothetical protein